MPPEAILSSYGSSKKDDAADKGSDGGGSFDAFLTYLFDEGPPPPPIDATNIEDPPEKRGGEMKDGQAADQLGMAEDDIWQEGSTTGHRFCISQKSFFIISQWITLPLAFVLTSAVTYGIVKSIPSVIIRVCAVPIFICGGQVILSALIMNIGFISRVANLGPNPPMACEVSGEVAMLMLVYNEDPVPVVNRLKLMMRSFEASNAADKISWFVLSDTQDTEIAAQEEVLFARHLPNILYRRRVHNTRYKTGNLREWMSSYGESGVGRFEYMCILDTDSVIEADCLLHMWRTMGQDKQIAIVQSTILPINATSIFSRLMQHAAHTATRTYITGYAITHGGHSLYIGHNCLIRIKPFFELCALDEPVPLFGGHVLSHDFVESLILASKGWKVINLVTEDGSYEELPPTLLDYMKRDQRWCMGNLQHLVLAFTMKEIDLFSRLQLVQSSLAYLNSLLLIWIVLMGSCGLMLAQPHHDEEFILIMFVIMSFSLCLCFQLISLVECHLSPHKVARADFPTFRIHFLGVALTIGYTALLTPGLALFHTRIILMFLLTGKRITWGPQNREESGLSFRACTQACVLQTVFGTVLALLVIITNIFTTQRVVFLSCLLGFSGFGMIMFGPLMCFTSKSSGRFHEYIWKCMNSISEHSGCRSKSGSGRNPPSFLTGGTGHSSLDEHDEIGGIENMTVLNRRHTVTEKSSNSSR